MAELQPSRAATGNGLRRVVVTGLGMVTPLGCGVEPTWSRFVAGESGAIRLDDVIDVSDLPAKVACCIPRGEAANGGYNPDEWMEPRSGARSMSSSSTPWPRLARRSIMRIGVPRPTRIRRGPGVLIGSGIGGLAGISEAAIILKEKGPRRISPFFIPGRLINLASGYVSIEFGLKGPNHAVVTACSTGAHAIGDASRLIALGDAEVMVAGGAESPINRLSLAGFAACRALSTSFNDEPKRASRPYDAQRDGFVMGEGAGAVILEEREHALARGVPILAEIIGYGLSGDAFHITSPAEDGDGAYRSMAAALKRADIAAADLDYINAHGTSTPLGDEIELRAVERLLGNASADGRHVIHQIGDRASPRRRRGHRGDFLDSRHSRRDRSSDDQSRQPFSRDRDRPRPPCREDGARSISPCRTPSASEGPTLRSSSVDIHRE